MAHKINKYIGCKIEITPRESFPKRYYQHLSPEELIKEEIKWHKEWVRQFEEFLRDHRHQDANSLDINIIKKDVCSKCGEDWETEFENHIETCCNCGAIIEREEVLK